VYRTSRHFEPRNIPRNSLCNEPLNITENTIALHDVIRIVLVSQAQFHAVSLNAQLSRLQHARSSEQAPAQPKQQ